MSINLKKGDKINLSKDNNKLDKIMVGLGWDPIGSKKYSGKTAVFIAELYRYGHQWKFAAIGEGTNHTSISDMTREYMK